MVGRIDTNLGQVRYEIISATEHHNQIALENGKHDATRDEPNFKGAGRIYLYRVSRLSVEQGS